MKRKISVLQISYDYPPRPFWGMGVSVRALSDHLSGYCNLTLATPYRSSKIQGQRMSDKVKIISSDSEWDSRLLFSKLFPNDSYKDFELLSSWNLIFAKRVIEHYLSSSSSPPEIVHNHNWMTFKTAKIISQFFQVPLVESIHFFEKQYYRTGNQTTQGDMKEILDIESEMSHCADKLIFFSKNSRDAFLNLYPHCSRTRTTVIYHSIDLVRPSGIARNVKSTSNKLIVLYVGRLTLEKGVKYLIDAFKTISLRVRNLQLLVIGQGPIKSDLESETSGFDITFLGQVSHDKIGKYYKMADIFCLPSLTESFGLVITEAMSFGLPVLTTSGPTVPELVRNNIDGLTIPLRYSNNQVMLDEEKLAEALLSLVSDRSLRLKFGRAAEKRARDFSPQIEATKTLLLYNELIP